MVITNGNTKTLLNWFYKNSNPYQLLILYLGGSIEDRNIISKFLELKESIHVITGKQCAFILFDKNEEFTFTTLVGYRRLIMPGILLGESKKWDTGRGINYFKKISEINEHELNKENLIRNSITISTDFANHFNINPDNLPCILILNRYSGTPYLIPSKSSSEIEDYIRVFKNLSKFIYLNNYKIRQIVTKINILKESYESIDSFKKYGIPKHLCEPLLTQNDKWIIEVSNLERKIKYHFKEKNVPFILFFKIIDTPKKLNDLKVENEEIQVELKGKHYYISNKYFQRIKTYIMRKNNLKQEGISNSKYNSLKKEIIYKEKNKELIRQESINRILNANSKNFVDLKKEIEKVSKEFELFKKKEATRFSNEEKFKRMTKHFDQFLEITKKFKRLFELKSLFK